MKHIKEQIKKGQFDSLYLIYGQEDYLVQQAKNMLCPAITDMDDQINYTKFENIGNYLIEINKMVNIWVKSEKAK